MKTKYFNKLLVGLLSIGLLMIFLSLFLLPKYQIYTKNSIVFTFSFGLVLILYSLLCFFYISKKKKQKIDYKYSILEENRLVKVNNFILLTIILGFGVIYSIMFYKERSDFLWVTGSGVIFVVILLFIQYHKGLFKLHSLRKKRN